MSARTIAVAAATGGLLMTARNIGLWPGDAIMVPADHRRRRFGVAVVPRTRVAPGR